MDNRYRARTTLGFGIPFRRSIRGKSDPYFAHNRGFPACYTAYNWTTTICLIGGAKNVSCNKDEGKGKIKQEREGQGR